MCQDNAVTRAVGFHVSPLQVGVACMAGFLRPGIILVVASILSRRGLVASALIPLAALLVFVFGLVIDGPGLLGLFLFLLLSIVLVALVSFQDPCTTGSQLGWAWVWLAVVACQPVLLLAIVGFGGAL